MRRRLFVLSVAALAVLFGSGAPAVAAPITFTVSGVVDASDPAFAGIIDIGDALSVTYTFESSTAARAGSDSTFAVFDALTSLTLTIGSYTASSIAGPEIQVDNDPPPPFSDRYGVVSRASEGLTGPAIGSFALDAFLFRLDDASNGVFADALVLPTAIDLSDFTSTAFFIFFVDNSDPNGPVLASASGQLRQLQAVPEPAAIAVFGLGLAARAAWRRRR